jgi:hypothetical protein
MFLAAVILMLQLLCRLRCSGVICGRRTFSFDDEVMFVFVED